MTTLTQMEIQRRMTELGQDKPAQQLQERKTWKSSEYAEAYDRVGKLMEFIEWLESRQEISGRKGDEYLSVLYELEAFIDDIGTEGGQSAPQMRRR